MEKSSTYAGTAAKQLGLYALYLLVAMSFLIYILAFFAGTTGASVNGGAINEQRNSITIAVTQEPPQLDSTRSTDAVSFIVLAHTMEGLISYDDNDQLSPGVAEKWEIREDGATFWIRDEARWSDGRAVTAHDFEFAWKRVLDPSTASEYAFILYSIKNAEAVNQGNLPKEALGVRAISDLVLEVDFERPTPYFDKLVAFNTYYPVREDFFESTNGRYGADADMLLYNGPYVLAEWIHGASMLWKKNPHYWNDEKGFLDEIVTAYITNDSNASLNLFKDGQIVQTSLTAPMLQTAMEQRWQIDRFMDGSLFFLEFNHREGRVAENLNFRKALLLAQDPSELVYKVLKEASYLPAESLFPVWIQGLQGAFRKEYPSPEHRMDLIKAREHLDLAKKELGIEDFPPLVLLTGDASLSLLAAEYYQELYKKNLGLELRIDAQIFKQRLAKMTSGDFDIVMAGWGPDYFDALTFGDLFASWNLNNRGRYQSEQMDNLVRIAQSELDPKKRMDAFGSIQELIYEDAVIVPMYERGLSFVVDPRLKGFKRRSVGPDVDYNYAYIERP